MLKGPKRFQPPPQLQAPRRPPRWALLAAGICAFGLRETGSVIAKFMSFATFVALFVILLLDGQDRTLRLDPRVTAWAAELVGAEQISVGSVSISLGSPDMPPGITLEDLRIGGSDPVGDQSVGRVHTGLSLADGLQGQLRPELLEIGGLEMVMTRTAQGALTLRTAGGTAIELYNPEATQQQGELDFEDLLESLTLLTGAGLAERLHTVEFEELSFVFVDERSGRTWRTTNAEAELNKDDAGFAARLVAALTSDHGETLTIFATAQHNTVSGRTRNAIRFAGARPADLASQVSALAGLELIDAPASGALAAELDRTGTVVDLSGNLRIGAGAVTPLPNRKVAFDGAEAYFSYDPQSDVFSLSGLQVQTSYGALSSTGVLRPERGADGAITGLVAELDLSDVSVAPSEYLTKPISFPHGQATARVGFSPFRIDIGSATLYDPVGFDLPSASASATGRIQATPEAWEIAFDAKVSEIDLSRALPFWPAALATPVRNWVVKRVPEARVTRLDAYIRTGAEGVTTGLDFDFVDGTANVLGDLPTIENAAGNGTIFERRFDLTLSAGTASTAPGESVDLSGSRLAIPDLKQMPVMAELELEIDGSLAAALDIIDRKPLRLLERAGTERDLATGRGVAQVSLHLPLSADITPKDVRTHAEAVLTDVRAHGLMADRLLLADRIDLLATNEGITIDGPAILDTVPFTFAYFRGFEEGDGPANVFGEMAVSDENLRGIGVTLPPGTVSGQGLAQFDLVLPAGQPPELTADVSLAGLGMSIPALDWRKAESAAGTLRVEATLAEPADLTRVAIAAPGLALDGRLDLTDAGLVGADLDRLALYNWIDAPVSWRARADGGSEITVSGGRVDLRPDRPRGDGTGRTIIRARPDTLIVTDGIQLTNVDAQIDTGASPEGRFSGLVNGAVPIEGVLQPGGRAYMTAEDGGGLLAAAGVYENARGGTLRLSYLPDADGGPTTGVFSLQNTRAVNAPALAELLAVATLPALVDSLSGPGIGFTDVQGRYQIDGDVLAVQNARAVGPALGITLDGYYSFATSALDLTGVISPFYSVNGVVERIPLFGRLLGGRPGQGLLGATFRISGSADDPQVAVNPLSLLAPGAARELFQTSASKTPGE